MKGRRPPLGNPIWVIPEEDLEKIHRAKDLMANTGAAALEAAALRPPDLILLDMILPDIDGVAVCGRLREWTERPIMMLSALDGDALKIAALDAGADDYLRKPFSTGELLARVRAVMRRSARVDDGGPVVTFGDVEVDLSARSVRRGGELVHLTPREYGLLAELARHAGRLVTHSALLEAVWGPRATRETQYLRVYIAGPAAQAGARPLLAAVPAHRAGDRLPAGGRLPRHGGPRRRLTRQRAC